MAALFSLFFLISLPFSFFSPPFFLFFLKKKKNDDYATMLRATALFFFFDPICAFFFFPLEIRNRFRCLCVPFLRFLSPPPHLSCCCFSELIRTHSNAAFVLPATNVSPLSFLNLFFFKEVFLPSLLVTIAHIHSERKLRLPCCAAFSFLPTYLLFSLFPLCLLFFFFLFNRNSTDRVLHHSGHWISANTEDFNLHEAFIIIIIIVIIFCCCCLALLLLYFEERKKKGKTKRYLFFFLQASPF